MTSAPHPHRVARPARSTPFRVEVSGVWQDLALRTETACTRVFLVSAPGPDAAEVAGRQLFGGAAASRRCVALPARARVIADGE